MMMKINYVGSIRRTRYKNCEKTITLYYDNWDDFGYKTTFHMGYTDEHGDNINIGAIKICESDICHENHRKINSISKDTNLPIGEIECLPKNFCSLGQDLKFYENLKAYCPNDYFNILSRLRDLTVIGKDREEFLLIDGVQISLLRESSAVKALNQACEYLEKGKLNAKDISFSFLAEVPYMHDMQTKIDFDFHYNKYIPYRINAIVGKNGTGKTQVLTDLANKLSGLESHNKQFENKRPLVYKVISVSYSAFDSFKKNKVLFEKTREDNCTSKSLITYKDIQSYVYCGIQSKDGTLSIDALEKNFRNAFNIVNEKGRLKSWEEIMREVMELEHVKTVEKILRGEIKEVNWSSGQHILICTLTEILANIEEESIILFDEPEIHLHPNAVSNTLRMLNKLLEQYNSYLILATHSPLIIQEIPSKYIQVFERENDILTVRRPMIECFGENISKITNEIFDVKSNESYYRTCLKTALNELSVDQINNLFGDKLSFNAMIYLVNTLKREG